MNFKTFLAIALLLVLASCHKDPVSSPVAPESPAKPLADNYHLTKGSYWIYQVYDVDTLNNYTLRPALDSCYISRDSVIRGNTCHFRTGTYFGIAGIWQLYLRDSSGWLVDESGYRYSNVNGVAIVETAAVVNNNPYSTAISMLPGKQMITVPAGTFGCLEALATYKDTNPQFSWQVLRNCYDEFAPGIGSIRQTAFYHSQQNHMERRLLRYHLQ